MLMDQIEIKKYHNTGVEWNKTSANDVSRG